MGTATGCTAAQIAANDKVQWLRLYRNTIGQARAGAVEVAANTVQRLTLP